MVVTLNRAGRARPRYVAFNGASFDRLFDEILSPTVRAPLVAPTLAARFDVVEKGDGYEARIEIPGVRKEDIDVRIEGASVRIKADVKAEAQSEGPAVADAPKAEGAAIPKAADAAVPDRDRVTRSWVRNFDLPAEVDTTRAEAAYENGVLTLTLPKKQAVQPARLAIK